MGEDGGDGDEEDEDEEEQDAGEAERVGCVDGTLGGDGDGSFCSAVSRDSASAKGWSGAFSTWKFSKSGNGPMLKVALW